MKKSFRNSTACKILMTFAYVISTGLAAAGCIGTLYIARYDCYTQDKNEFQKNMMQNHLIDDCWMLDEAFNHLENDGYFDENIPDQRKQFLYQEFMKNYQEDQTNFFFRIYDADDQLLLSSYDAEKQLSYVYFHNDNMIQESEQIMNEKEYQRFTNQFDLDNENRSFTAEQIVVPRGDPAPTLEGETTEPQTESITENTEASTESITEATEQTESVPDLTESPITESASALGLTAKAEDLTDTGYSFGEQLEIAQALSRTNISDGYEEHDDYITIYDSNADNPNILFTVYFRNLVSRMPNLNIFCQEGWHYVIDSNTVPPEMISVSEYIYRYPEEFQVSAVLPAISPTEQEAEYCDIYYDVHIYETKYPVTHYITGYVRSDLKAQDHYLNDATVSDLAYQYRYIIPVIAACSGIVMLLCMIFLISSAGYHAGEESPRGTFIEQIPYDLFTGMLLFSALILFWFVQEVGLRDGMIGFISATGLCMIWSLILIWWLMSTACRFRIKTLLNHNIIVYVIKWLISVFHKGNQKMQHLPNVFKMLPFVWKAGLIAGGVILISILTDLGIHESNGIALSLKILLYMAEFLGTCVIVYQLHVLEQGGQNLADGHLDEKISEKYLFGAFRTHAQHLNSIGDGMNKAVADRLKSEMFRTELIANVSHDIRTPLTSIINYTDLLSKLNLTDQTALEYIQVLSRQSGRLKKLTEDVLEASKATTGSMKVNRENMDLKVLLQQLEGEYTERFEAKSLQYISNIPEDSLPVLADGRLLWRAMDNLFSNICKYAMPHTRVYINTKIENQKIQITLRNISAVELNIPSDALLERFVRGDRSRNTEGSGLGLSIAQSLIRLQDGEMQLYIDGDLFKVEIILPLKN